MKPLLTFLRNWTLPISMLTGVLGYFVYTNLHFLDSTHHAAESIISILQPFLIFAMLFLTFCRIRISDLHLCRWHLWLLLLQTGAFALGAWVLTLLPTSHWGVVIEGAMLCMICPTATAAAVVTGKLGGNQSSLTSYTILINLAVALIVPVLVPLIHPHPELTFWSSFLLIISKVFPLLICPLLLAALLRRISPRITEWFCHIRDLAFYIWAFSLALAIAVTVRSIVHSTCPVIYEIGIAISSLIACIIQFSFGRMIGCIYGEPISATQSCGQKNTVFAIWMGYTFMDPVTSIAGGFYSVWHNVFNSYQLYQARKKASKNPNIG